MKKLQKDSSITQTEEASIAVRIMYLSKKSWFTNKYDSNCDNLTLIAFSETRDVEIDGKCIHIYSATDWLLRD